MAKEMTHLKGRLGVMRLFDFYQKYCTIYFLSCFRFCDHDFVDWPNRCFTKMDNVCILPPNFGINGSRAHTHVDLLSNDTVTIVSIDFSDNQFWLIKNARDETCIGESLVSLPRHVADFWIRNIDSSGTVDLIVTFLNGHVTLLRVDDQIVNAFDLLIGQPLPRNTAQYLELVDVNQDGFEDILVSNMQKLYFLRGTNTSSEFKEAMVISRNEFKTETTEAYDFQPPVARSKAVSAKDIDGDSFVDIVMLSDDGRLLWNKYDYTNEVFEDTKVILNPSSNEHPEGTSLNITSINLFVVGILADGISHVVAEVNVSGELHDRAIILVKNVHGNGSLWVAEHLFLLTDYAFTPVDLRLADINNKIGQELLTLGTMEQMYIFENIVEDAAFSWKHSFQEGPGAYFAQGSFVDIDGDGYDDILTDGVDWFRNGSFAFGFVLCLRCTVILKTSNTRFENDTIVTHVDNRCSDIRARPSNLGFKCSIVEPSIRCWGFATANIRES